MATQSVTIMTTPGPNPSAVQAAIAAVVAGNTQATASVNPASVDATLAKEATDSLNVAVSDLKPTADVDVTVNGVTQTVRRVNWQPSRRSCRWPLLLSQYSPPQPGKQTEAGVALHMRNGGRVTAVITRRTLIQRMA